jgi:diacylglycerol kinase (ATP)
VTERYAGTAGFDNPQKQRRGMNRLWHALGHSISGLRAGWMETAFRLEVVLAVPMVLLAFLMGRSWSETVILCGSLFAVLVVELLNTAVESTVDRIGPQWHEMSKKAKDIGSAAVLVTLLFCIVVWSSLLITRLL